MTQKDGKDSTHKKKKMIAAQSNTDQEKKAKRCLKLEVGTFSSSGPSQIRDLTLVPTKEEYVTMLDDDRPQTTADIQTFVKGWKGKGRLHLREEREFHQGDAHGRELREMSYEPLSPCYQGSPAPLTDGPDRRTETPPRIESPILPIADEAIVEEYMAKLRAQQERLDLLENPTTTPEVFEATLEAFHENREPGDDIHVEHLIAGPSGTYHDDDGKAKVKEEELESPPSSVSLLSSVEALPIHIHKHATSTTGLLQPEAVVPPPTLTMIDAAPFTTDDFIGWMENPDFRVPLYQETEGTKAGTFIRLYQTVYQQARQASQLKEEIANALESLQETKNTVESLEKRLRLVCNHQQHHEKTCNNTLLSFQSSISHRAIYDNAPEFFRTKFGVTAPAPDTLTPEQVATQIPEIPQMQQHIAILPQYRVQPCTFNTTKKWLDSLTCPHPEHHDYMCNSCLLFGHVQWDCPNHRCLNCGKACGNKPGSCRRTHEPYVILPLQYQHKLERGRSPVHRRGTCGRLANRGRTRKITTQSGFVYEEIPLTEDIDLPEPKPFTTAPEALTYYYGPTDRPPVTIETLATLVESLKRKKEEHPDEPIVCQNDIASPRQSLVDTHPPEAEEYITIHDLLYKD